MEMAATDFPAYSGEVQSDVWELKLLSSRGETGRFAETVNPGGRTSDFPNGCGVFLDTLSWRNCYQRKAKRRESGEDKREFEEHLKKDCGVNLSGGQLE
jgi:hypothetical protein